jgi:integrase
MPNYKLTGKRESLTDDVTFFEKVKSKELTLGKEKTAFLCLLYYLGCRVSEGLALRGKDFRVDDKRLYVNIKRLKHSKQVPANHIRIDRPYIKDIISLINRTNPRSRLWPFSRITAWRFISKNGFIYPHYWRLNRLSQFLHKGYTIDQVKSWCGLTLKALDSYVGLVSTRKMGDSI